MSEVPSKPENRPGEGTEASSCKLIEGPNQNPNPALLGRAGRTLLERYPEIAFGLRGYAPWAQVSSVANWDEAINFQTEVTSSRGGTPEGQFNVRDGVTKLLAYYYTPPDMTRKVHYNSTEEVITLFGRNPPAAVLTVASFWTPTKGETRGSWSPPALAVIGLPSTSNGCYRFEQPTVNTALPGYPKSLAPGGVPHPTNGPVDEFHPIGGTIYSAGREPGLEASINDYKQLKGRVYNFRGLEMMKLVGVPSGMVPAVDNLPHSRKADHSIHQRRVDYAALYDGGIFHKIRHITLDSAEDVTSIDSMDSHQRTTNRQVLVPKFFPIPQRAAIPFGAIWDAKISAEDWCESFSELSAGNGSVANWPEKIPGFHTWCEARKKFPEPFVTRWVHEEDIADVLPGHDVPKVLGIVSKTIIHRQKLDKLTIATEGTVKARRVENMNKNRKSYVRK